MESALVLGLFPDCAVEEVQVVGNAAGEGAKQALFDRSKREEGAGIARIRITSYNVYYTKLLRPLSK